MTARRRVLALAGAATVALGAGVATGVAGQGDGPRAPIPRVCWFSDYANAKLSNKCDYRSDERRWYMEVDGAMVPADTQKLPVANLCLYFSGTTCPKK